MNALPRLGDAQAKALLADGGLRQAGELAQVFVGEAVLLCLDEHVVGQGLSLVSGDVGENLLLFGHELGHLLDELALDGSKRVELIHRRTLAQGLVHHELTLARGIEQKIDEFAKRLLVKVLGEAQTVTTLLQRADGLLEGLFVRLADAHDLAHGAHLRAELVFHALELLERPTRELDYHVVARGHVLVERAPLAARDLGQRESARQHGGDECDGETRRLGSQRGGARGTRVDLDDDVAVAHGVVRPLYVGAADDLHGIHDAVALLLQAIDDGLVDGLHGCGAERVAGMHAHRVDVFDGADGDHLAGGVTHDLKLELFPAEHRLLHQHLVHGTRRQATRHDGTQLVHVVHQAAAGTAHGVSRAKHARISQVAGDVHRLIHGVGHFGACHLDAELVHELLEGLAVLATLDGVYLHADDLHAILVQHARLCQLAREVKRRLPAEVRQDSVGTLLLDDGGQALNVERLYIGAVRRTGVGHDGSRVRIHQHDLIAEASQGLARLGARVVELAGLAYDDRARANDHDFMYVCPLCHRNSVPSSRPKIFTSLATNAPCNLSDKRNSHIVNNLRSRRKLQRPKNVCRNVHIARPNVRLRTRPTKLCAVSDI